MLTIAKTERGLTRREAEVLQLVAGGWTSKQIGAHLGISPKTVEVFRQGLLRKVGVKNSVQLVLAARARGWLEEPAAGLVES